MMSTEWDFWTRLWRKKREGLGENTKPSQDVLDADRAEEIDMLNWLHLSRYGLDQD